MTYMDGKTGAEELIAKVLTIQPAAGAGGRSQAPGKRRARRRGVMQSWPKPDPSAQAQPGGEAETLEASDFSSLLQREFKPKSDQAKEAVESAVKTLAEQALQHTTLISKDVVKSIESMIAAIDQKLTEQLNQIMHHPDFQQLESAWRGLHYLVNNTETDEMLKIRVMNISKKELHKTLEEIQGHRLGSESALQEDVRGRIRAVRRRAVRLPGRRLSLRSQPARCGIAGRDGQSLRRRPLPVHRRRRADRDADGFLAGAQQSARSHQDFPDPGIRRLAFAARIRGFPLYRSGDAAVSGPAALWGEDPIRWRNSISRRTPKGADHNKYAWANSAYAMATNINRSFKLYGWCSRIRGIESGGAVEGLPTHTFPTDDGGVDMKCPTEIAISDRREAELAKNGFMPLIHRKNSDFAAFIGAQSLQKPAEYEDPDATANANLSARLPYLFATCRFAHYLKCIVRDKIGSFKERDDMQRWLQNWIIQYVDGDPATPAR